MNSAYIISIAALKRNAEILRQVRQAAGCRIVMALKGFACRKTFAYLREYLDGCCASGLWEAQLASEYFGKSVITYGPAYLPQDVAPLCEISDHLDFNSLSHWRKYAAQIKNHPRYASGALKVGLRVNPECSTGKTPLYDPCAPNSRLGVLASELEGADLSGLSGLHFHTLCEQYTDDLAKTLAAFDDKFGALMRASQFDHLNIGGGHWITKPDYDREHLRRLIGELQDKYGAEIWLEPGEAVAIHTGVLRANVLDVFDRNGARHVILDVSVTAHLPDVLEMPYVPTVFLVDNKCGSADAKPCVALPHEKYAQADVNGKGERHVLGCPTCLAGDVFGVFHFPRKLVVGDALVFDDMAHYTMVKTTTFNGVRHPAIALLHENGELETVREFTYADFRDRLA